MPMTTRLALPFALLTLLPYAAAAQQSAQNLGTQHHSVLGFPAHNGPIEVVLDDQRAQTIFQAIVKMTGVTAVSTLPSMRRNPERWCRFIYRPRVYRMRWIRRRPRQTPIGDLSARIPS